MEEDSMRNIYVGVILMASVAVWAADKVQPLNVKVGLWEVTMNMTSSGEMPVPAELLARLTPEQRARVDERMKARSAEKTKTTTHKNCLTKENLDQGTTFGEDKKSCTRTIIASTSSKAEVRLVCEDQGMKTDATFQIDALSAESVKGSVHMMMDGGGHTMNSNSSFTAKWIGPVCGATN
jgi:uncharacterized protein DUF3617